MKKLRFAVPTRHRFINLQPLLVDSPDFPLSIPSTPFHSPSFSDAQAVHQRREYPVSTHFQEIIPFLSSDMCFQQRKNETKHINYRGKKALIPRAIS
jgi:hypothetical protein